MSTKFAYILFKNGQFKTWFIPERPPVPRVVYRRFWREVKSWDGDWVEVKRQMHKWQEEQIPVILAQKLRFLGETAARELVEKGVWGEYKLKQIGEGTCY